MSEKYAKILSTTVATLLGASMMLSSLALAGCGGAKKPAKTTTASQSTDNTPTSSGEQPNIVFILLDDSGITELGCYGNEFNETPNIDKIASEGTRFTSYYTQPVCSPSRSCSMTGEGTLRTGISNFLDAQNSVYLNPEEFTLLPQLLKNNGYHTGIIGKWHLCAGYENYPTSGAPKFAGFDEVILSEQRYIGPGYYFYPYWHLPQVTDGKKGDYLIDVMNVAAVNYIEEAAKKDEPFFLYLSHYATHTTLDAPADTVKYFQQKRGESGSKSTQDRNPYLAAMLKHVDNGVGAIEATLEKLGIKDNTMVVIASDNGGSLEFTSNGIYRGGKSQLYEGGLRDPLIIRYPNLSKEARVTDFPSSVMDLYDTFAEAARVKEIPENRGLSLLPLVTGSTPPDRDTLYWAFLRQSGTNENSTITYDTASGGGVAIRWNNYKYFESLEYYRRELYDLDKDPSEKNNIIDQNPELADTLARKLHALLASDTEGKTFSAEFASNEHYRWNSTSGISKSSGKVSSDGSSLSVMTREDLLMYNTESTLKITVSDQGMAGLLIRSSLAGPAKSAFRGYGIGISAETQSVSLVNITAQSSKVIASAPCTVETGKTYTLKVVADGANFKVYLDDTLVLECSNELYFHGSAGLFSDKCKASFDSLKVSGLKPSESYTDIQINSKPQVAKNIMADFHYLPSGVVAVDGNEYLNLSELATALALPYSQKTSTFVLDLDGDSYALSAGNKLVTVNGKSTSLSTAPIVQGEKFLAPLSLLELMGLSVSEKGDTLHIRSVTNQIIPYNDSRIKYSSGSWSDLGMTMRSPDKGATAELTFIGKSIKLYLDRGNLACIFDVYIDGEKVATIDAYNPTALSRSMMFEHHFETAGEHTIKIVNTGTKRAEGGGTNLNITAFEIALKGSSQGEKPASTSKILYSDSAIKYEGNWSVAGETYRSKAAGESCEYEFYGTGIDLYMGVGTGAGIFEVYIDGALVKTVNPYSPSAKTDIYFSQTNLAEGTHTIKLVNTGTKDPAGTATNMNLAYFIIYSEK